MDTRACHHYLFKRIWLALFFLMPFYVYISGNKNEKLIFWSYWLNFGIQICLHPPLRQKKFVLFIGFMVFKTTGLSSQFQRKNLFWKICTGSRDMNQNVPKFRSPNQTCIFWDVLANISGLGAYFSKPIFALKPWAQAGRFEYHEAYNRRNYFWPIKGSRNFF